MARAGDRPEFGPTPAVASGRERAFPDGVDFIAFAPVAVPDLVAPVVAQALGLRPAGNRSTVEHLVAAIAAALFLSPRTFDHHVARLVAKFGVRTRAARPPVLAPGSFEPTNDQPT